MSDNKNFAGGEFLGSIFSGEEEVKPEINSDVNDPKKIEKATGIDFRKNTINGVNIDSLFGDNAEIKNGQIIKQTEKNAPTTDGKKSKGETGSISKSSKDKISEEKTSSTDNIIDDKVSKETNTPSKGTIKKDEVNPPGVKRVYNVKTKPPRYIIVVSIILAIILGLVSGLGGAYIYDNFYNTSATASNVLNINAKGDISIAEAVAKKASSSVVGVIASREINVQGFFGETEKQEESGLGTGFIVDTAGYILTNAHVVLDGEAEKITVVFSDNSEASGEVVYCDTGVDLAILKVNKSGLTPVTLGNSDTLNIGSYIIAIGNPEALDYYGTVTQGIVSGLHRNIKTSDGTGKTKVMEDLIQLDAAINGGNSGGPLFNAKGEVVGINTAKAATSTSGNSLEGMGFAIPINLAKPIIQSIKKSGKYERPMIGISTIELSDAILSGEINKSDTGAEEGLYIIKVEQNSPAEKAELKAGDVVIKIGSKDVKNNGDIISYLLDKKFGKKIPITYYRGQSKRTTSVVLDKNYTNS
ncbi:MAG: trypsin-like peptidase domain-containing protein [Clostridiales Family XIII bacterium]|nr:trypsin-like peptidase domain-containing protein [Clostridiales Family XIII bacterium]